MTKTRTILFAVSAIWVVMFISASVDYYLHGNTLFGLSFFWLSALMGSLSGVLIRNYLKERAVNCAKSEKARYVLNCTCGRSIAVVSNQAGTTITCECGTSLDVPPLRQLLGPSLAAEITKES